MLAAQHRLARNEGFGTVLKKGRRAGNRYMVVNIFLDDNQISGARKSVSKGGIVVGKRQVPGAVDRNRIKRRMRHQLVERLEDLPGKARVVVRVLGPSISLSSEELGRNLDRLIASIWKRLEHDETLMGSVNSGVEA